MLLCNAERNPGDEAERGAEILRGLLRFDLPAALLRILTIIVIERGSHAKCRAYPSRRRVVMK